MSCPKITSVPFPPSAHAVAPVIIKLIRVERQSCSGKCIKFTPPARSTWNSLTFPSTANNVIKFIKFSLRDAILSGGCCRLHYKIWFENCHGVRFCEKLWQSRCARRKKKSNAQEVSAGAGGSSAWNFCEIGLRCSYTTTAHINRLIHPWSGLFGNLF